MPILSGFKTAEQHLPQYIPLPFDAMLQAGQQLQANANTFRDTESTDSSNASNLKAVPGSPDEEYLKTYVQNISDIQNKYKDMNLTDPTILSKYKSDIKGITNSNYLNNIQATYDNLITELKSQREMNKQGKGNPILNQITLDKFKKSTPEEVGDYMTPEYTHYRDKTETYFNNLKDKNLGFIEAPDGSQVPINGIDEGMIEKVALDNIYQYQTSPEFQNEYAIHTYGQDINALDEDAKKYTYKDYNGVEHNFTNFADKLSYDQLMSAGHEKITDTTGKLTNSKGGNGGFTYGADGYPIAPVDDVAGNEYVEDLNTGKTPSIQLTAALLGHSSNDYVHDVDDKNNFKNNYVLINTNNIGTDAFVMPNTVTGDYDIGKEQYLNKINRVRLEPTNLELVKQQMGKQFSDKFEYKNRTVIDSDGAVAYTKNYDLIDKSTGKIISDDVISAYAELWNKKQTDAIVKDAKEQGYDIKPEDYATGSTSDISMDEFSQTLGNGQFGSIPFTPDKIQNISTKGKGDYLITPYISGNLMFSEADFGNLVNAMGFSSDLLPSELDKYHNFMFGKQEIEDTDFYKKYFTKMNGKDGSPYWMVKYNVPADVTNEHLDNANVDLNPKSDNKDFQKSKPIWWKDRAMNKSVIADHNVSAFYFNDQFKKDPNFLKQVIAIANANPGAFSSEDLNTLKGGTMTQAILTNLYKATTYNPDAVTVYTKLNSLEQSGGDPTKIVDMPSTYTFTDNSSGRISYGTLQKLNTLPQQYQSLTLSSEYRTPETNKSNDGVPNSLHMSGNAIDVAKSDEENNAFFEWIMNTPSGKKWLADNKAEAYWENDSTMVDTKDKANHLHIEFNQ